MAVTSVTDKPAAAVLGSFSGNSLDGYRGGASVAGGSGAAPTSSSSSLSSSTYTAGSNAHGIVF